MADTPPIASRIESKDQPICPWCLYLQVNYTLTEFFDCESETCGMQIQLKTLSNDSDVTFVTQPVCCME